MPKINFVLLQRAVRRDYAALGTPISQTVADRIVEDTINDGLFQQWLTQIDEYDADRGLTDIDGHTDTTAKQAIMRTLRAQHKQEAAA